eukprot:1190900-Prorocentrum_minimum.AAC.1
MFYPRAIHIHHPGVSVNAAAAAVEVPDALGLRGLLVADDKALHGGLRLEYVPLCPVPAGAVPLATQRASRDGVNEGGLPHTRPPEQDDHVTVREVHEGRLCSGNELPEHLPTGCHTNVTPTGAGLMLNQWSHQRLH